MRKVLYELYYMILT